ncbi:MAG: hypothetical protein GAK28_04007 [Luteibacter sp.]|uniref:hypothetical protein n=1 Tax=Luteibacter sp. TaxID=1886636 RepID=UPI00137E2DA4|nr:hypothetical protein [Luteibacter sp.]KAF1004485.1 MAG: hypothetical protein GAK28_04007 [Luteibacter sp.]
MPSSQPRSMHHVTLLLVMTSAAAAIATPCLADSKASSYPSGWPQTHQAQRDFSETAIITDLNSSPRKLWMISAPVSGAAKGLEFFTGERVDVHVDGKAYTFSDSSGHRYESRRARPSSVDLTDPSISAGWEKDGKGHDVIVGAKLKDVSNASQLFSGDKICESTPYVISTEASRFQASEAGFTPRTKMVADFNVKSNCWTTEPTHVVNLEDNTFLLFTEDRVIRINSMDLTPSGPAPDFKIVDIKEK